MEIKIKALYAKDISIANVMAKTGCTQECGLEFYNKKGNDGVPGVHVAMKHRGNRTAHPHNAQLENNLPYLLNKLIDWHNDND